MSTSAVEKCWSCHQMHERPGYCPNEFRFQKHRGYKEESCPYCNPKAVTAPPRKPLDGRTHYEGCEKIHTDCAKTPQTFEEWWNDPRKPFHDSKREWADRQIMEACWLAATERAARIVREHKCEGYGSPNDCGPDGIFCRENIAAAIRGADAPTATTEKGKA